MLKIIHSDILEHTQSNRCVRVSSNKLKFKYYIMKDTHTYKYLELEYIQTFIHTCTCTRILHTYRTTYIIIQRKKYVYKATRCIESRAHGSMKNDCTLNICK